MTALGPGDVVECVDASGTPLLAAGDRYTIAEVLPNVFRQRCFYDGCREDGVSLHEVGFKPAALEGGFCIHRFRPVYRREAGAFDHLLKGADAPRELEPA